MARAASLPAAFTGAGEQRFASCNASKPRRRVGGAAATKRGAVATRIKPRDRTEFAFAPGHHGRRRTRRAAGATSRSSVFRDAAGAKRGDVAIFREADNQQNRLGTAQLRRFSESLHLGVVWRACARKALWMEVPFTEVVQPTPPGALQERVQALNAAPERRWAGDRVSRRAAGAVNKRDLVRVDVPT